MLAAFPRPAVGLAAAMAVVGAVLPAAPAVATSAPAGAGGALLRYEIGAVIAGGASGTVSAMAMNEAGEVTGAANQPLDGFRWSETSLDVLPDPPRAHRPHRSGPRRHEDRRRDRRPLRRGQLPARGPLGGRRPRGPRRARADRGQRGVRRQRRRHGRRVGKRGVRLALVGEVQVLGGAGSFNRMYGINNDGTAVGRGVVGVGGYERGVISHDDLGLRYVDDLLTTNEIQIGRARDINDAGQILASGFDTYTGDSLTVRLDPVSGPLMHEEGFSVRLVAGSKAVAKLRMVDEQGDPVRRARVMAAWYDGDLLVEHGATDRTDDRGRARLTRDTRGMASVRLCITEITHRRYSYVPADGGLPPCAQATAIEP